MQLVEDTKLLNPVFRWIDQRPHLELLFRVLGLVFLFVIVDQSLKRYTQLSSTDYERMSLILVFIGKNPLGSLLFFIGFIWIYMKTSFGEPWNIRKEGNCLRWFVIPIAAGLTWQFSTYGYNYFHDQSHLPDRAALVLLLILVWYRPAFLLPFVISVYVILYQLTAPGLGGSILEHKLLLTQMLTLFAVWWIARSISRVPRTSDLVFLTCCLLAGRYWQAGLTKLQLDWVAHGEIYRGLIGAYGHGWLSFLTADQLVQLANRLRPFDTLLVWAVIALELTAILMVANRRLSIALMAGFVAFHLSVFALIGYLFWTWILADFAVIYLFVSTRKAPDFDIFKLRYFVLSIPVIGLSLYWNQPPRLGWYDTQLTYNYRFDAVGVSGNRYTLSPEYFSLFEDAMTMSTFEYLSADHAVLTGPYGVTQRKEIVAGLDRATSPEDIFALEQDHGILNRYSREKSERLLAFVKRYVEKRNPHPAPNRLQRLLGPPPQFWSFGWEAPYNYQEPIVEVAVKEVTLWYDGKKLQVIRDKILHIIAIETKGTTEPS